MKVTTEELERCEVLLTVEVDAAQQEKMLKKAAQRVSRQVKIPGFRPGKAPYNVIVRRFGLEALQREALDDSVENLLKESMAEVNLTPYAQIQLEGVEWEPALTIKMRVPVKPVVELGDYRNTRLEPKPVEVTDEDVEDSLKRLQEQQATWVPVERPAELGDLLSMTVTEKDGETVLTERQAVEYELKPVTPEEEDDEAEVEAGVEAETQAEAEVEAEAGEEAEAQAEVEADEAEETETKTSSQPDLTTPLLGLSAGESKTFTITYPEDFGSEQYAGKEITFEVEVSAVKVKELDPLDDDFAQQVGEFTTLEALKDNIHQEIRQSRERMNDFELGTEALEQVIENAEKIDWPQALEDEQVDHEIEHYEQHLKQAGLTLDAALQVQKKTKEDLREETRESVISQLKRGLVLGKLAELEKLTVSQMEVLEQAKLMADMYGGGDRMWQNILSSEARQGTISNELLSNKVIQRLAAVAKGEAPEPGAEESPAEIESISATTETDQTVAESGVEEPAAEVESTEPAASNDAVVPDPVADDTPPVNAESEVEVENESSEAVASKV